jgi:hypothetical protein
MLNLLPPVEEIVNSGYKDWCSSFNIINISESSESKSDELEMQFSRYW